VVVYNSEKEKQQPRGEIAPHKRVLKLVPALGDWTTYKPKKVLVKRIKSGLYGFDRLSENELKEMHLIHYRFAESWLELLKSNLHLSGELYTIEAIQSNYQLFIKSLNEPLLQAKITLDDPSEEVFLSFDLDIVDSLINFGLGCKDSGGLKRELTEIENSVVDDILKKFFSPYKNSFNGAFDKHNLQIISSPEIVPNSAVNPTESFIYFVIQASVGNSSGKIVFGYPSKLSKKLLKRKKDKKKIKSLPINKLNLEMLEKILLPLVTTLGKTTLTTTELLSLETGDVLSLDNSIQNAIPAVLAGKQILGQPGIKDNKLSMKIIGLEKKKELRITPPKIEEKEEEALEEKIEEVPEEKFEEEETFEEETPTEEMAEEEGSEEIPEEMPEEIHKEKIEIPKTIEKEEKPPEKEEEIEGEFGEEEEVEKELGEEETEEEEFKEEEFGDDIFGDEKEGFDEEFPDEDLGEEGFEEEGGEEEKLE
jgi:flagellar motor switch protein FliM